MNRLKNHYYFFLLIYLAFIASCLSAQPNKMQEAISQLKADDGSDLTVEMAMAQYGLPGLSVVVFEDYQIIWSKTWGVKEMGTNDLIDEQTAFSTASISKAITATLMAILEEKGLFDIDQPVNNYLKRWHLPENEFTQTGPVTIKHILSHTAGTSQHGFTDFYEGDKVPTILESVQGKLPSYDAPIEVQFKPGTNWQYSGGGYTIAQMALEDQLGKSLAELAQIYLFGPLKLEHTTMYQHGDPRFLKNVAKAHNNQGEVIRTGIPICPQTAASAMWSTPTDMARLAIEIQKALKGEPGPVISTAVAKRVTEIITYKVVGGWGLGWDRLHRAGNRGWFSHGGANTGTGGHVYGTMEDGHGIAFFGNGPNGIRIPILDKLRNSIIESHGWRRPNPFLKREIPLDQQTKEGMIGLYFSPFNQVISVELKDDHLYIPSFAGQVEPKLYPLGQNLFGAEDFNMLFKLKTDGTGFVWVPEFDTKEEIVFFQKINPDPTLPADWIRQGDIAKAQVIYEALPVSDDRRAGMINEQGYQFLRAQELDAALATFKLNVALYPENSNVHDSLGEGYLAKGMKEESIKHYKKSLELDPNNENAKRMLEKM